ncbi:H-2 class II histocompatibility antigen, A-Q alpha chain-like [Brachyhypopomus gauderio]|uniref:H-2 class II histocompatibility antigen, A-Q alpha chain-like n=1 Tax=Brachyhypopomus gauderio TaxID=698409 RepID=UPI0040436B70
MITYLCLSVICVLLVSTETKVVHRDLGFAMCSDTNGEYLYGVDGEEMGHADFTKKEFVMTLPDFADPLTYGEGAYEAAVGEVDICRTNLNNHKKAFNYPAEAKNPPQSSIYFKDDVLLESKNTLICYITGFYPPQAGVSWTRNNVNMTDEATLSRYYLTTDGNFNLVSALSFTPQQGDIYTCTVQHSALDRPLTKTWEVDVSLPSVGPSVFCGVGLAVGLLGVATGTFFLIKGNQCN